MRIDEIKQWIERCDEVGLVRLVRQTCEARLAEMEQPKPEQEELTDGR